MLLAGNRPHGIVIEALLEVNMAISKMPGRVARPWKHDKV